jgi:DNA-directed RNA polymerase subunit RPC12/RpoP
MTHKYGRQCWNCGSKNMERLANHVRCRDCGATWNVVPKVHAIPVLDEVTELVTRAGRVRVKGFRPSGTVRRRASRARARAESK